MPIICVVYTFLAVEILIHVDVLQICVYTLPMPKETRYPNQFLMRTDDEFDEALEQLRSAERPVLSRADFIRKLVFDLHRKAVREGRIEEGTVVSIAKRRK